MTLERNLKKLQEPKNLQEREEMNLQLSWITFKLNGISFPSCINYYPVYCVL